MNNKRQLLKNTEEIKKLIQFSIEMNVGNPNIKDINIINDIFEIKLDIAIYLLSITKL